MRVTRNLARGICAAFLLTASGLYAASNSLEAKVTSDAVEVEHVSPGGEVVLFTAQLEATGGLLRQRTGATRVLDGDRDGAVMFQSPRPIPHRSIWVIVDLETGRSRVAAPDGYEPRILPFPTNLTRKEPEGIVGVFDDERYSAEMLIVRPRQGAWRLVAFEGAGGDGDRQSNGKLSLASADAEPVGNSGRAPKHLKAGDVVAIIDAGRMEVFVTEIGK